MTAGELARRLRFLLRRRQCLDELDEEMRLHAELCRQAGTGRSFGNATFLKEKSRDMWGWNWLDDLAKDVRYAFRLVRGSPMFTGIVMLTLALGIGANTAMFSVMNAVVVRLLPVNDPQQIIYIRATDQPHNTWNTGNWGWSMSAGVYEQLRTDHSVLSDVMAYVPLAIGKAAVRYGQDPEEASADMVSGNFFKGLGVGPVCGRVLTDRDEADHTQVAVLSYSYWSRRFGQSCSVIGQPIYIKGVPFTIVGVAAERFQGVDPMNSSGATDIWVPLQNRPGLNAWGSEADKPFYANPQWLCLMLIGRLHPGISARDGAARLTPIFQRAAYAPLGKPERGEKMPVLVFDSTKGIPGLKEAYDTALRVLLAMVGLILIIASSNIVMMLNARNTARWREFSIRLAIGGSKWRLFRQLMAESLLLVAAGTVLGYLFAIGGTRAITRWSAFNVDFSPDRTVLLFTLGIMSAVALIFGIFPLRNALKTPVNLALKTGAATAYSDSSRMRARKVVIALQMCLCFILLVAAGLLLRTLRNLETVNMGMHTQGLLVFGISPQQETRSDAETIRFYESLTNRLRGLPGVVSVTLMGNRLGSGWTNNTSVYVDGKHPETKGSNMVRWNNVGPDYLSTLGIKLEYGRDLRESDSANSAKVSLINDTFAKRYFKGQNPLGRHISLSNKADDQWIVVGIAADSKYANVNEETMPMAYFPYKQRKGAETMQVEVRTIGNAASFLPVIQKEVRKLAPNLPLLQPMTQQAQFDESYSTQRLVARLAVFFGLLAALLVATGLYATLAYAVARRTAEIGIRMALGAQRREVLWMVMKESLVMCAAGIAAGLPLALACSRVLRSILFGVRPSDPLTISLALLGLVAVAMAASFIPAGRAVSIDPISALRNE